MILDFNMKAGDLLYVKNIPADRYFIDGISWGEEGCYTVLAEFERPIQLLSGKAGGIEYIKLLTPYGRVVDVRRFLVKCLWDQAPRT